MGTKEFIQGRKLDLVKILAVLLTTTGDPDEDTLLLTNRG